MSKKLQRQRHGVQTFFFKNDTIVGDPDLHPCFDVAMNIFPHRAPSLGTAMATLCTKSFDAGAGVTDFGSAISAFLPYPCSCNAWAAVGSAMAGATLDMLAPVTEVYRVNLPSVTSETESLEAILNVIGELWRSTCISILKEEGYESERAMMCFVTLHFLLLCLAEERPGLRAHAVSSVEEFLGLVENEPAENLKLRVPDLGRFLVRFLLTGDHASLSKHTSIVVRELFSRNVRWVPKEEWATAEATDEEKEDQEDASFEAGQFGMKLTVFQSYYILRSAELGLDTLKALDSCRGRPSPNALKLFQQDCKDIKALECYADVLAWLRFECAEEDIHKMLFEAVTESEARDYNAGLRR